MGPVKREEMAELVEQMVMASNDMVETLMDPEMPGLVQNVAKGAVKGLDMGPGRMEKMRNGEKRIMQVLENGEWKKVEGMLDMLVMMVSSDGMWLEADKEVKIWAPLIASSLPQANTWAAPHMVNQALGDLAGGGEWALTEY